MFVIATTLTKQFYDNSSKSVAKKERDKERKKQTKSKERKR
jgi:hypothetical protein